MMTSALKNFWQEEDGQDLVEYSLLLAFIALAAISVLSGIKSNISSVFTSINSNLANAATAAS